MEVETRLRWIPIYNVSILAVLWWIRTGSIPLIETRDPLWGWIIYDVMCLGTFTAMATTSRIIKLTKSTRIAPNTELPW